MRWKEHPIADSVSKCQTWNPKSSGASSFDYIDLSSVDKDTKSISSTERYECSDAPSRARQLVEADDVLVATVRPNLNGVALVNGDHHGMTASTGFCVLRPDKDKLDSRFLFHWVKTDVFVRRMVDVATGANYPAVSDAKVKASNVPLPPLPDQKRIARILDAADALRAKRREALAQLDTLLQSTFLDMFADPVTNPMEWQEQSLGDLTQSGFRNGLSPSTKGTVDGEVLTLSAITRGRFDFAARKSARFDKQPPPSQRLRTDTFLICRGNGNKQLVGAGAYPDRSSSRVCFPDTMISVMVDSDAILPVYGRPRKCKLFFERIRACGQVLSSIRPRRWRHLQRRRACMELRGSGPNRLLELKALRAKTGFPHPVSMTVCPYPSSVLPAFPTICGIPLPVTPQREPGTSPCSSSRPKPPGPFGWPTPPRRASSVSAPACWPAMGRSFRRGVSRGAPPPWHR